MTENSRPKIGGILLAAGASTRFGAPKQFSQINGKTLIRIAAEAIAGSLCETSIVVLGPETEKAVAEIDGLGLHAVFNANWRSGMASSIDAGIGRLLELSPDAGAVVITLCDQPLVTAECIDRLAIAFTENYPAIVASEYNGIAGVPALFDAAVIPRLREISGDKGARDLIRDPQINVRTVAMPEAAVDIDTQSDLIDMSDRN